VDQIEVHEVLENADVTQAALPTQAVTDPTLTQVNNTAPMLSQNLEAVISPIALNEAQANFLSLSLSSNPDDF